MGNDHKEQGGGNTMSPITSTPRGREGPDELSHLHSTVEEGEPKEIHHAHMEGDTTDDSTTCTS